MSKDKKEILTFALDLVRIVSGGYDGEICGAEEAAKEIVKLFSPCCNLCTESDICMVIVGCPECLKNYRAIHKN